MKNEADLRGCYPTRPITPSLICLILHILRKPNSLIANQLSLQNINVLLFLTADYYFFAGKYIAES